MKFGPLPIADAVGKILGHNVAGPDGRRLMRKGRVLTGADAALLASHGRSHVYVAELEAGDVDEDTAAAAIASAIAGDNLRNSKATTGRVNVYADVLGILRVNVAQLMALNRYPGVALATMPNHAVVDAGQMAATLKIIPYAIPGAVVEQCRKFSALLQLTPLQPRRVHLILSGFPTARERIVRSFSSALRPRLARLNASLDTVDFVALEDTSGEQALAALLQEKGSSCDLLILAGETAIMDRHDIAPRAIERAGGSIICFGAPVDPGNLLLLAELDGVPIVGAPGCSRSPKENIIDLVLPRLLAGDRLTQEDVIAFAHGGMLDDVPERPLPRSRLPTDE